MNQSGQFFTSLTATSLADVMMNDSNLLRALGGDRFERTFKSSSMMFLMYSTILALNGFLPVDLRM